MEYEDNNNEESRTTLLGAVTKRVTSAAGAALLPRPPGGEGRGCPGSRSPSGGASAATGVSVRQTWARGFSQVMLSRKFNILLVQSVMISFFFSKM